MDELSKYTDGLKQGQLIMIATVRKSIELGATPEQLSSTLNAIEKQLTDE